MLPVATIFISHSSKDHDVAGRLATDLRGLGHAVFLDEYCIKVGDCIIAKIEDAIKKADYVIVILSPNATNSKWVEREWRAKFWDEVNSGRTHVLPALVENCEIPPLLKTKRYADFRLSYGIGLVQLTSSIDPLIKGGTPAGFSQADASAASASALLAKVQSRSVPLSQCIAEALSIAQGAADATFEGFCRNELAGWKVEKPPHDGSLSYRAIQVYIAPFGEINAAYFGWGGDLANALDYMRRDKENFFPFTLIIPYAVSKLEAEFAGHNTKGLLSVQLRQGDLLKESANPERLVTAYCRPDAYGSILEGIRRELTEHLLKQLPRAVLD